MPGDRLLRILTQLRATDDSQSEAARLCEVCADVLDMTGAGVMLMSGDVPRGSVCSSNDVSELIEDLQYTLGEGPCIDAYSHRAAGPRARPRRPGRARWIAFTPPAVAAGARAIFGFPLQIGSVRLGALNLYRDQPGALTDDQHADALVVSEVAARAVLDMQAHAARRDRRRSCPTRTSGSSCTKPPAWSRSSSGSASPKR